MAFLPLCSWTKEIWDGIAAEHRVSPKCFLVLAVVILLVSGHVDIAATVTCLLLVTQLMMDARTERISQWLDLLLQSAPKSAIADHGDSETIVPVETLCVGDLVSIESGDTIPVDAEVVSGYGFCHSSPLMAWTKEIKKVPGDHVCAGDMLKVGSLGLRVTRASRETAHFLTIAALQNAMTPRATANWRVKDVHGLLVVLLLAATPVAYQSIHSVTTLAALLIAFSSIDLSKARVLVYVSAIVQAARLGILVKTGESLELFAKSDSLIVEKRGLITREAPIVVDVRVSDPHFLPESLLQLAASALSGSNHPIARAMVCAARETRLSIDDPTSFEETIGKGIKATVRGRNLHVGTGDFLSQAGIAVDRTFSDKSTVLVYVAVEQRFRGVISVLDDIRANARDSIITLREQGFAHLAMLSVDRKTASQEVAQELGLHLVDGEDDQGEILDVIAVQQRKGSVVSFLGDGANFASAFAKADCSLLAFEDRYRDTADVPGFVLEKKDLSLVVSLRAIARRTRRIVRQNIWFAMAIVPGACLAFISVGWMGPLMAALLQAFPYWFVLKNSFRPRWEDHAQE